MHSEWGTDVYICGSMSLNRRHNNSSVGVCACPSSKVVDKVVDSLQFSAKDEGKLTHQNCITRKQ